MNISEAYLERLPYWIRLTENEKELVKQSSSVRKYQEGSIIFGAGIACPGMMMIIHGDVRAYMLSEEGREITLFRLRDADTCVISASCVIAQISFDTQIIAEKDTEALIVPSPEFSRLTEKNIYVRCYMYESLTECFASVMRTMQQILFMGYDQRLASYLLSEYERSGNKEIQATHEQIARQTSSAREVVARMLKRFSSEGLVEFRRGSVTIKDVERLKKLL